MCSVLRRKVTFCAVLCRDTSLARMFASDGTSRCRGAGHKGYVSLRICLVPSGDNVSVPVSFVPHIFDEAFAFCNCVFTGHSLSLSKITKSSPKNARPIRAIAPLQSWSSNPEPHHPQNYQGTAHTYQESFAVAGA